MMGAALIAMRLCIAHALVSPMFFGRRRRPPPCAVFRVLRAGPKSLEDLSRSIISACSLSTASRTPEVDVAPADFFLHARCGMPSIQLGRHLSPGGAPQSRVGLLCSGMPCDRTATKRRSSLQAGRFAVFVDSAEVVYWTFGADQSCRMLLCSGLARRSRGAHSSRLRWWLPCLLQQPSPMRRPQPFNAMAR